MKKIIPLLMICALSFSSCEYDSGLSKETSAAETGAVATEAVTSEPIEIQADLSANVSENPNLDYSELNEMLRKYYSNFIGMYSNDGMNKVGDGNGEYEMQIETSTYMVSGISTDGGYITAYKNDGEIIRYELTVFGESYHSSTCNYYILDENVICITTYTLKRSDQYSPFRSMDWDIIYCDYSKYWLIDGELYISDDVYGSILLCEDVENIAAEKALIYNYVSGDIYSYEKILELYSKSVEVGEKEPPIH
jgi:hypothetical protein